ncbi:MAG: hypothetical protein NC548_38910 [Lachnospiraceae bacterium]|nr:hypothetical protein [Lachnospiraceae bacterium]
MSACKYHSVFKGKIECKHTTMGAYKTKLFPGIYGIYDPCDRCKRKYGNRYPSEVPKDELWKYEEENKEEDGE